MDEKDDIENNIEDKITSYKDALNEIVIINEYTKDSEEEIADIKKRIEIIDKSDFKTKLELIPILNSIYILKHNNLNKICNLLKEYLVKEISKSTQISQNIILNIFSCKKSYKKQLSLDTIFELIKGIYNHWSSHYKVQILSSDIYVSLFHVYESIDDFINKNLLKKNNVDLYIKKESNTIKWNLIYSNIKHNKELIEYDLNKKWMFYISQFNFINDLIVISDLLRKIKLTKRDNIFKDFIDLINESLLPAKIYEPLDNQYNLNKEYKLKNLLDSYSYLINTNERVPLQIMFEYCYDCTNENDEMKISDKTKQIKPKKKTKDNIGIFGEFSLNELNKNLSENIFITSSIIKGGDELRQDYFISQIIIYFNDIFKKENINVNLNTFNIISNGMGGFMQTIESTSLNKINEIEYESNFSEERKLLNKQVDEKNNNSSNEILSKFEKYFLYKFITKNEEKKDIDFYLNNFITTLAGFSFICYLFDVKDRNNGNILLDNKGNIIHIDYGFMLNKTPGNIKFEKAPFKITNDFIHLMGGVNSNYYYFFNMIFISIFKAIRKNYRNLINIIKIFSNMYSDLDIFSDNANIEEKIIEKLFLKEESDNEIDKKIFQIINDSLTSWRTSLYDAFQKYYVGVK